MTALNATALGAGYGTVQVLTDINLRFEPGSVTVIAGGNGTGKSTFLRTLAGLLPPCSGAVSPVGSLLPAARRELLAYLPQTLPPALAIEVREAVGLGAIAPGAWSLDAAGNDRVDAALARFDLLALKAARIDRISGGEQRRAALAAALGQGAPWLLLDEPTAGLDLAHAGQAFGALRRWVADQPQNRGVIAAVHDLNLAARCADRLILLGERGVLADGAPDDVLSSDALCRSMGGDLARFRDPQSGQMVVLPVVR
jgi:iron complex transport system ATP-binding protein